MRLLLPKPERDWARWRSGLAPVGVDLSLVDPWRLEVFAETPAQRTTWLDLDAFRGVVCVSPTAADCLAAALDRYWPMPPVGVDWLCNGPGTAAVLSAAGLTPRYPTTDNTAEAVLAMIPDSALAGHKWLVVRGEGGRLVYPGALAERGAEVTERSVYRRALEPGALARLAAQREQADAILVSSLTLAEGLLAQDPRWRDWPGLWLMSSERLADWAGGAGLARVHSTAGASLEAVRSALDRIRP